MTFLPGDHLDHHARLASLPVHHRPRPGNLQFRERDGEDELLPALDHGEDDNSLAANNYHQPLPQLLKPNVEFLSPSTNNSVKPDLAQCLLVTVGRQSSSRTLWKNFFHPTFIRDQSPEQPADIALSKELLYLQTCSTPSLRWQSQLPCPEYLGFGRFDIK